MVAWDFIKWKEIDNLLEILKHPDHVNIRMAFHNKDQFWNNLWCKPWTMSCAQMLSTKFLYYSYYHVGNVMQVSVKLGTLLAVR